ncbi:MAG: hypothetical protein E6L07_12390 [Verrucomicrobia bacterium]|nr:MAG: hypothetical protein E6L07_12390 [Verrucomicrobiota bacterium]
MKNYESTYALLVRSEEKNRSVLETVVCALLILSIVFSIWQFVQQPVRIPAAGLQGPPCVACTTTVADHPARS